MNPEIWAGVANGILTTLLMTAIGFIGGAIFGVPVLLLRVSKIKPLRWIGRTFIEVVRGVPLLVWLFLIYNGPTQFDPSLGRVFTSFISAVLALSLVSSVYMAEIYRGSLTAISKVQWEAGAALGFAKLDSARFVIAPQVVRVATPASANYAIGLLKDSSLVSTIGVFEITYYSATLSATTSSATPFFVAGAYYLMMTIPSAWATRKLDARLRSKVVR